MARELVKRYSDYLVRANHPINKGVDPHVPLDDDAGVVSCAYKIYDISKDEVLLANEASGQTELSVSNAGVFVIGDSVEVTQDDETLLATTVTAVNTTDGTVTIDDVLTDNAAAGKRIRAIFGASVAMLEYGTADLDTITWGYQAGIPEDNAVHLDPRTKTGLDVDIEIRFNGGAGLAAFDTICITLQEDDCD